MKISLTLVFLVSLLLIGAAVTQAAAAAAAGIPDPSFCSTKCSERCSKSGRPKLCLKYCGICCGKCSCVPSGTYGNKSECPCYASILNSKGKSKCP